MITRTFFTQIWKDFSTLFFPKSCLSCHQRPPQPSVPICTTCENELSFTHFHQEKNNEVTERFWGRLEIIYGTAFLFFTKKSVVQNLIYELKYNNKPKVGSMLGEWFGYELRNSHFKEVDIIIPVPLHPKRRHQRGYNQSEMIAQGLSKIIQKPSFNNALIRIENTTTQTQKSRTERFENVKNAFKVKQLHLLQGKHLLLVDDVLTTGATLEACALKLLEIPNVKVSIATIGLAKY